MLTSGFCLNEEKDKLQTKAVDVMVFTKGAIILIEIFSHFLKPLNNILVQKM